MTLLALLLLASPVWAGELSNTSGSLRVQVGDAPQPGVDSSRCYLKGESVPCVGHAYDRRVGSVRTETHAPAVQQPGGSVWLDAGGQHYKTQIDGEWKPIPGGGSVAMESPIDGKLKVIQVPSAELIRCDEAMQSCEVRDPSKFPCYQKMQEAMTEMQKSIALESNQKDRKQPVWMIPELLKPSSWNRVMKECVK